MIILKEQSLALNDHYVPCIYYLLLTQGFHKDTFCNHNW